MTVTISTPTYDAAIYTSTTNQGISVEMNGTPANDSLRRDKSLSSTIAEKFQEKGRDDEQHLLRMVQDVLDREEAGSLWAHL
jgi:hypothetical protein